MLPMKPWLNGVEWSGAFEWILLNFYFIFSTFHRQTTSSTTYTLDVFLLSFAFGMNELILYALFHFLSFIHDMMMMMRKSLLYTTQVCITTVCIWYLMENVFSFLWTNKKRKITVNVGKHSNLNRKLCPSNTRTYFQKFKYAGNWIQFFFCMNNFLTDNENSMM